MNKLQEAQLNMHLKELSKNLDNLTPAQKKKTRKMCNDLGVGESKARRKEKNTKEDWLESAKAKELQKAFPDRKVGVAVWNMVTGKRKRTPLYVLSSKQENIELFKKSIKYIIDNYSTAE